MNTPVKVIPYGKHYIDNDDIEAVVDVLTNQFLTQGKLVSEFEASLSDYTGAKYCTSVNSGTSGLHVACLAAGISQKDWVWTVPNSFVASANCARYCGAQVDFVDIDPLSRNISVAALEKKIAQAKKVAKLPKLLIVVHFSGLSCEMERISELCKFHNIILVEDAAHGLGGSYKESKIGSCSYSDMTVLSFHPVKSITTAEGGAILTNSADIQTRLQLFSKHGVTREQAQMSEQSHGPWYYQQVALGYNYRLSDIHAALGLSQMRKLDDFVNKRASLAKHYTQLLTDLPLKLPRVPAHCASAWHLYMIELESHDRKKVFNALRGKGIGVNVHYIPIHIQPYYQELGFSCGDFPAAEKFYENAITIPLFPTMTADEQDRIIQSLHEVLV